MRSSSNSKVFPSELTVKTLIVYNALQGAYTGYIRIFWQPFVLSLGISLASIGLLETFSGSSGVLSSVLQLFGGRLSDRFGRKLLCTLGSFFLVLCWLVAAIAFVIHRSFLIIVSYLLWSASVLALPVLDAALADNVKESERSRVYSVVLLANVVPASITGFFAGNLATKSGPVLLLLLASLLEGLGLLLLFKGLRSSPVVLLVKEDFKTVFKDAVKHWRYFSVFTADALSWSISVSLLPALLTKKHFSNYLFSVLAATIPLGTAFGTLPSFTNKIHGKRLLLISECLGVFVWLGFGAFPEPELVPIYGFTWGCAISTWVPVQFHVLTSAFPSEKRGELLGAVATFRGLVATLGPIIALALFLNFGYVAPFVASVIGILITMPLIVKFV